MVTHFTIIFLTLACLLIIYFIAWLQVHFHLRIKINEYHSSLQNKPTVTENLHFTMYWTRIQESQLCFYPLLLLILVFLPSIHLLFHLTLRHGLVYDFTIWGTAARGRKNPVTNSVWLRGKTSETQRTWSRKGRRQATEAEWNFSVFSTFRRPVRTRDNSLLLPTHFSYSLFIKIVFEQPFGSWIVKASWLHSLEWSTNKTHVKSFEYINRETQSIRENSRSANCKTFLKILTTSEHCNCNGNIKKEN